MESIFSKIVKGEIPAHKLAENDRFMAFLDINPLTEGHALVIPKKEVDYIFDLEDKDLADLHVFAKGVAQAIQKATGCRRIGTCVIGFEVPHAHLHLIPINSMSDMNFANPKLKLTNEKLAGIAQKIKAAYNNK
jgi:histidine triad (HIT) family protein